MNCSGFSDAKKVSTSSTSVQFDLCWPEWALHTTKLWVSLPQRKVSDHFLHPQWLYALDVVQKLLGCSAFEIPKTGFNSHIWVPMVPIFAPFGYSYYVYVIVCIRNWSLYILTAIISVIIYNDRKKSVCIYNGQLKPVIIYNDQQFSLPFHKQTSFFV